MPKHALFMVHGMGDQQKGWEKGAVKKLRNAWKDADLIDRYGTFDSNYDIKPLRYSKKIMDYWEEYRKKAQSLGAIDITGAPAIIKAIYKITTKEPDTDNSLLTHWTDVLLYASTDFNHEIPIDMAGEILEKLIKENVYNYSIIGHSMGTRVVHDALQRAYSGSEPAYQALGIPTVLLQAANVTNLMSFNSEEFKGDKYKVFPTNELFAGACRYLISANHKADIIASLKPFEMHQNDISNKYVAKNFHDVELNFLELYHDLSFSNIIDFIAEAHSIENYMSHPDIYVPFFNRTKYPYEEGPPPISSSKHKELVKNYKTNSKIGKIKQNLKIVSGELKEIPNESLSEKVKSIDNILSASEEMMGLLKGFKKKDEN
jgi:hypothetical protein